MRIKSLTSILFLVVCAVTGTANAASREDLAEVAAMITEGHTVFKKPEQVIPTNRSLPHQVSYFVQFTWKGAEYRIRYYAPNTEDFSFSDFLVGFQSKAGVDGIRQAVFGMDSLDGKIDYATYCASLKCRRPIHFSIYGGITAELREDLRQSKEGKRAQRIVDNAIAAMIQYKRTHEKR